MTTRFGAAAQPEPATPSPQAVPVNGQVVYEPGFWVAHTTAGYYYPARWVLRARAAGTLGWVLLNGGAVPPAR